MNLHERFTIAPQVLVNQLDEELVILSLASSTYFGLDSVGADIWYCLSNGKTIAETCQELLDKYDVSPSDIERDVVNLVNELLLKKLVYHHRLTQ